MPTTSKRVLSLIGTWQFLLWISAAGRIIHRVAEPILSYKSIPVRPPGRPRGRASFWLALSAVTCCGCAWFIAALGLGYPADGFLFLVMLLIAEVLAVRSVVHAVQSLRWTREERTQAIIGVAVSAMVISLGILVVGSLLV